MIVFLDVDGVLANWNKGMMDCLGIEYDYEHWPYTKGRGGWNWHEEAGVPFGILNALCDFDLWADLPWMHDGREIYDRVKATFGLHNIRLLTTPMPNVQSASGKMGWILNHVPELAKQAIITTADKDVFATVPSSVLIDDSSKNVEKWRGAGGCAILVPRPWNDDHAFSLRTAEVVGGRLSVFQRYLMEVRHG